uniref:Secreted protein n=1 Tax=Elaeophora elaphi TaxID=1147741 RepID=A0A0R3S3K4_9BILA
LKFFSSYFGQIEQKVYKFTSHQNAKAFGWCQSCPTPCNFSDHLKCIKETVSDNYGSFEKEIREHNRLAIKSCFAQTIADGNQENRCVLALSDLENKAWDRNGPLRGCSICRTFANGAIKAMLSTSAEEQKCVRMEVSRAVKLEAEYCLRQKIVNFGRLPEFPDFEEGSYAFRDEVINSISDHILIYSRLAFCNARNSGRAEATRQCLKNPFDGYLTKHCRVLKNCESKISDCCQPQVLQLSKATCECVENTRAELKKRLASIAQAIKDAIDNNDRGAASIGGGSKVDQCVSSIKSLVRTPVNDWIEVIDKALEKCLKKKPAGQNLGLDSLVNVGCRKVIADTTGTAHEQLKTGFDFINNLMDAMVDRAGRFCGGVHCG